MNEYLYDKLVILNTIYNNTIKPQTNLNYSISDNKIKTNLLPHQVQLINAMHVYRNKLSKGFVNASHVINGKIGIIGDSYGTGKTLSVLSYLASTSSLIQQQNVSIELDTNSTKYFYSHNMYELTNNRISNLIIVPHQLFTQWKTEITKHTSLKFVPIETRRFIKGEELANTIINSSFVLTTSKCYKYVQEFAIQNNISWNNIFIDEATSIYLSPSDPILQFQFLWFITNDWLPLIFRYTNLNKKDLYALKDRLQPSLHPELEEWLLNTKPINQDNHIVSSGYLREYLPYLHQLRGHIVLRNSLEYINSSIKLPNITRSVIKCRPLLSINSIISYINTQYNDLNEYTTILDNKVIDIFQALNIDFIDFNKYVWKQPVYKHALIKRKYAEDECVICLDKPQYPTILKCCYNVYCGKCLLRNMLVNQKCPTCRCQLTINDISCIGELTDNMRINGKSKQEVCLSLIEDTTKNKNKYIIYTMFDNIYYQMHSSFIEKGIIAERIENNLFSILKTVKNFNEGATQVLFISNPMLIKGISFTNTTHLLFFHEAPFFEMEQILIHSAQRLGREKDLQIYHLNSECVL